MKNKHWEEFLKTGKIDDYLKYREELSQELMEDFKKNDTKNNDRNHLKDN